MKSFGNYFELDLRKGKHYHEGAIKLNSGRNCLQYILKAKQYKKIFIPYYTCQVILNAVTKCNVQYEFYSINESLEPLKDYILGPDEAFLYTNYFDLKNEVSIRLADLYGTHLIVDNSLAFYAKPIPGIDTIYSARKFFGVADGAYLYTDVLLKEDLEQDLSYDRMSHLLIRIDVSIEASYDDFLFNEKKLTAQPIKKMSKLTEKLLMGIDYEYIKHTRIENYLYLDAVLKKDNFLKIDYTKDTVPMVYPFLLGSENNLREKLIKNKIYVKTFWNNVFDWCKSDQLEYLFAKNIMAFPIDQKYNKEDMKQMIMIIKRLFEY